jgi:hypothetical protein
MQVWGQSCPFDCFFFERFDDFALQHQLLGVDSFLPIAEKPFLA